MEDAGICPPYGMYYEISSFARKSCGAESAAIIKERLGADTYTIVTRYFWRE